MNKKGLTLIELLAVIALIAVITIIAVSSVSGVNNTIKKNLLKNKITLIEEAALLKGQNMLMAVKNSPYQYNADGDEVYPCQHFLVSELVPEYMDVDVENCEEGNCIINPEDNTYLDNTDVIVYYKKKKLHVVVDIDNKCSTYNEEDCKIIDSASNNQKVYSVSNCYKYGDTDDDGSIMNNDILLLTRCVTGLQGLQFCKLKRHDMNLDGNIDCYDSLLIYDYLWNEEGISSLPYKPLVSQYSSMLGETKNCGTTGD